MLESKIEQLTAAIIGMTERLDRFNQHFEYVLYTKGLQGEPVAVEVTPTPTTPPTPAPTPAPVEPSATDYTELRSNVRSLCIKAVQQKKLTKAGILAMFAEHKEGCDVVDNLPDDALPVIAKKLADMGVTR